MFHCTVCGPRALAGGGGALGPGTPTSVHATPSTLASMPVMPTPAYGLEVEALSVRKRPAPPGRVSPLPVGKKRLAGPASSARCTGSEGAPPAWRRASHSCATSTTPSRPPPRGARVPLPAGADARPCSGAAAAAAAALPRHPAHRLAALAPAAPSW